MSPKRDMDVPPNGSCTSEAIQISNKTEPPSAESVVDRAHALGEGKDKDRKAEATATCAKCKERSGDRCRLFGVKSEQAARWCDASEWAEGWGVSTESFGAIAQERPEWTDEDWTAALLYGTPDDLAEQVKEARNPGGYLRNALRTSGDEWLNLGREEQARRRRADGQRQRQTEAKQQQVEEQKRRRETNLAAYRERWAKVGVSPKEIEQRAKELRDFYPNELDSEREGEPEEAARVIGRVTYQGRSVLLLEGSDPDLVRLHLAQRARCPEKEAVTELFAESEPPAAWWPAVLEQARTFATKTAEWNADARKSALWSVRNLRYAQARVECWRRETDPSAISMDEIEAQVQTELDSLSTGEVFALAERTSREATPEQHIALGIRPPGMDEQTYLLKRRAFSLQVMKPAESHQKRQAGRRSGKTARTPREAIPVAAAGVRS